MAEPIYAGASEGYDELFARATQLFTLALLRAGRIMSGQTVLDVATGTGIAARAAADVVGPSGSVHRRRHLTRDACGDAEQFEGAAGYA
jgi:hypothetical protein